MTHLPQHDEQHPTPDAQAGSQGPALTPRRGILLAGGITVGAGVLAACSSPPVPAVTTSSTPAASSTSSSGAASTTGGGASPDAGAIPTSEVPVGGAKFLPDRKTVVTQPVAGTFKAFDTTCTHQQCAVTSVVDGQIDCPCHHSRYDLSTGEPVAGPAPAPLTAKTVTVSGDTLTVS